MNESEFITIAVEPARLPAGQRGGVAAAYGLRPRLGDGRYPAAI